MRRRSTHKRTSTGGAFVRMDRVELVTHDGTHIGLLLRRNGSWWSLLRDDGCVYADTEDEALARAELQRLIDDVEADGGFTRRRWRNTDNEVSE